MTPLPRLATACAVTALLLARPGPADEPAVPKSPLTPDAEQATFRLAPGLRVELVAAEPQVESPVACAVDERGRLWLAPARTWLGVEENEIVCYDEAGQALGDYRALAAALAQETEARAEAERRAEAAETRLRELEAELRRLRGEAP